MAKGGITTAGLDETIAGFETLAESGNRIISMALYDGARVMADALVAAVEALPVDNNPGHPFSGPLHVITSQDKADLAAAIGIAHFDNSDDGRTTSIGGFTGYATRTEKNFPNGVPLRMIARSINSGSSVRAKDPFVRRTARGAAAACTAAMVATGEKIAQEAFKGG